MPNRNWLHSVAVGGCLVAVLWLVAVANAQTVNQQPTKAAQTERADDQPSQTFIEAIDRLRSTIKSVSTDDDTSHKSQREKDDLDAQRQMAKWAFFMTVVTAISAGISLVGILLLVKTLKYSSQATLAAVRQADASQASERAHVEIETTFLNFEALNKGGVLYGKPPHWNLCCRVQLHNFGRTVAMISGSRAELLLAEKLPSKPTFRFASEFGKEFKLPADKPLMMPDVNNDRSITDEEMSRFKNESDGLGVFLFGNIRYRDVFGIWRERGFAYRFFADGHAMPINGPEYDYERTVTQESPSWLGRLRRRLGMAT